MNYRRFIVPLSICIAVTLLLIINFFLLKRNSEAIDASKNQLETAAMVRVKMTEVIRNVHLLDLGIRGYALVRNKQIENSIDSAISHKNKIHLALTKALREQGFPLGRVNLLKDTVNSYFAAVEKIRGLINGQKMDQAKELIAMDSGFGVWLFYQSLLSEITAFEDALTTKYTEQYRSALRNSYFFQFLLVLIIIPALGYLIFYTLRSFALSDRLLLLEGERNRILQTQKTELEKMVYERTQEIAAQNEEILAQNEEIQAHNEQLVAQQADIENQRSLLQVKNAQLEESGTVILKQKLIIEGKNLVLTSELEQQNQDLRSANYELIQKTNRIEQFAYMISHNLRAPIARLIGLTNIFSHAKAQEEMGYLADKTHHSALELDQIVHDLSSIMQIQRLSTEVFSEIVLEDVLTKTKQILKNEITSTHTKIKTTFEVTSFYSLAPYIDNIFYNLVSNSIKYRYPDRAPVILIKSMADSGKIFLYFSDNGLGIDLAAHEINIFGLYRRFHFHVEGRGLGLYLVKTQIEMLGGKITVHSTINEGTSFKIELPLKQ